MKLILMAIALVAGSQIPIQGASMPNSARH